MLTGKKLENRMESLDPEFSRYKDAKIMGKTFYRSDIQPKRYQPWGIRLHFRPKTRSE